MNIQELVSLRYSPKSIQHLQALIIVDELARLGVSDFIISPGMRAVPLIKALESKFAERLNKKLINDERSASFFANGVSKAGGYPCLICTSGTAVANYLPGIVEAYYSETPVLIITTDRPWEIRDAGANQTINQKNIFNDFCIRKIDIPAPENSLHIHSLLSNLDYLFNESIHKSRPVHLNLAYRKPYFDDEFKLSSLSTEDISVLSNWFADNDPYINFSKSINLLGDLSFNQVASNSTLDNKKVIAVCGPRPVNLDEELKDKLVCQLLEEKQIPLFADIHSNLRRKDQPFLSSHFSLFLEDLVGKNLLPDMVFYFGGRIISDNLQKYLADKSVKIIKFTTSLERQDAIENEFIYPKEIISDFRQFLSAIEGTDVDTDFSKLIIEREREVKETLQLTIRNEVKSERSYIKQLIESLPEESLVFLSASLVFREADNFVSHVSENVKILGNRGATGIDGIISSGLGVQSYLKKPVLILLGDQAALHDLNAFSLIMKSDYPVIVAIINNYGGAIFNIVSDKSGRRTLVNEHAFNFKDFAKGFNVKYAAPNNVDEVLELMDDCLKSNDKLILELIVDGEESANKFNKI